jgi:hypothetical protein
MFIIIFGAILLVLFLAFWLWHSPLKGKLTREEIEHYLERIARVPLPAKGGREALARIRAWAETDDGKPVYMLNLIRFFPQLHPFPGAPDFPGTPEQANAFYEKGITFLWLQNASYPIVAGKAQGKDLLPAPPGLDDWSRVLVCRYPSRRTFLRLLADPAYAPWVPYKFMAVEIVLVPVSGDAVVPDLRWVVGGILLTLFLLVGWVQAAVF